MPYFAFAKLAQKIGVVSEANAVAEACLQLCLFNPEVKVILPVARQIHSFCTFAPASAKGFYPFQGTVATVEKRENGCIPYVARVSELWADLNDSGDSPVFGL